MLKQKMLQGCTILSIKLKAKIVKEGNFATKRKKALN